MTNSRADANASIAKALALAVDCQRAGDLRAAELLYTKILETQPAHPSALHNLGLLYARTHRLAQGRALLDKSLVILPGEAPFRFNYAVVLQNEGLLNDAIGHYRQAIRLNSAYHQAWENLGVALQDSGLYEEAVAAYEKALALTGGSLIAYRNLVSIHRLLGRNAEARAWVEKGLQRFPANGDLHMQHVVDQLAAGDFSGGWDEYEWRYNAPLTLEQSTPRRMPFAKWNGEPLQGKTLLVYGEQGIGDEVMFAACVPTVAARAASCIVECDPRLVELFRRSFPDCAIFPRERRDVFVWRRDFPDVDYRISSPGLPRHLRQSLADFGAGKPYLKADPGQVAHWRERLATLGDGLKIGISWRGGAGKRRQDLRSLPLEAWAPIVNGGNGVFVNLQYGEAHAEISASGLPIRVLEGLDPLTDLDGFAAAISALDLVISIDNSTVHFAGALGVPTWVLMPLGAEWRWFGGEDCTPWYGSLRLFRSGRAGKEGWYEVVERAAEALRHTYRLTHQGATLAVPQPAHRGHGAREKSQGGTRVLLVNDTAYWYHWGCTCTSLALHEGLRREAVSLVSLPIDTCQELSGLPATLAQFDDASFFDKFSRDHVALMDALTNVDRVVINGEGSLHGLGNLVTALLYIAYVAKTRLGKEVHLVNHSCFPDEHAATTGSVASQLYAKVYRVLDRIVVRERLSAQIVEGLGAQPVQGFDCLPLFVERHWRADGARERRVVIAGSAALSAALVDAFTELTKALVGQGYRVELLVGANAYLARDDIEFATALARSLGGDFQLRVAHSEADWLAAIAGAGLVVSGRFHHTIAAAFLDTPFVLTASNTPKVEGLLDMLGVDAAAVHCPQPQGGRLLAMALALLKESAPARLVPDRRDMLLALGRKNFSY